MRDRLKPRALPEKPNNPDRFTFYVQKEDRQLMEQFRAEAVRRRVSVSALLMEAVEAWLNGSG